MFRRTRYQQGSVQREKRRSGPDVWVYRWYEVGSDGASKYRKAIVGTVLTLPTEAVALKAARALRIDANQQTPQSESGPSTIAELVAHYRLKELAGDSNGRKAFSTRDGYECYLDNWILPRWQDHKLNQVKPVAVEAWLDSIKRARGTRAKIRNIMSAVFHHAMRYEWLDANPIKLVRQSAKRERTPDVLELAELQLLLTKLELRERTLVLLDAATGLRVSELLALRWEDVDFKTLELSVTRSIWHQVVGNCKTETSAKPVPLDSYLAEDLLQWQRVSPYPMPHDWVFASPTMKGKQPYWPDNLMKRYIRPVAQKAGIHKRVGWHTFRHSFGTLLKANGEDIKTVQELLRHANSRITLEVYTQAVTSNKRAAQSKVVKMMVPNSGAIRVQTPIQAEG
jgi:integrase